MPNSFSTTTKAFQVNRQITRRLEKQKARIAHRLDEARRRRDDGRPIFGRTGPTYELSDRIRAMPHGGLGVMCNMVRRLGLAERIDDHLRVLAAHRPYHESDHVLNVAYNVVCGGC